MNTPLGWAEYGAKCREVGNWAKEVFVCFTSPTNSGPLHNNLLAEHKAYIASLEEQGKLFLAGPLSNEAGTHMSGAGLIVFVNVDLTEARALAAADPLHEAGVRNFRVQAWRLNEGSPLPGICLSRRSFDG